MDTALWIIEKYLDQSLIKTIAKTVLLSQDIHEESWDGKKYQLSGADAAQQAVEQTSLPNDWSVVIGTWNYFNWNGVQYWAQEILKEGIK